MKPFSGKFVLRVPAELHKRLSLEASKKGVSLNQLCIAVLSSPPVPQEPDLAESLGSEILPQLKDRFGEKLLGLIAFGSRIKGEATEASDVDFLIVLSRDIAVSRELYSWWDDNVHLNSNLTVNPHFVAYPDDVYQASGLWFEIAQAHRIIFQQARKMDDLMAELMTLISKGIIRRHWSNGHPYWIWRKNEEQDARV